MNAELKIELFGRVQGINFRWMIKHMADENDVRGYVTNKEDGSVLIVAQGEKKQLNDFISWIRSEPGFVKITGLNYAWQEPEIEYKEFTIKREQNYFVDKAKGVVNLTKRIIGKNTIPDGNI